MGNLDSVDNFEVVDPFWQSGSHQNRNFCFGFSLIILEFFNPAVTPPLCPFRLPDDRAAIMTVLVMNLL
jgi:hypothetical protein